MSHIKFELIEAKYSHVDSSWAKHRSIRKHHRIYYLTDGEAEFVLKEQTVKLIPGNLYLLPAFQLVSANCRVSMNQFYVHFASEVGYKRDLFEEYEPLLFVSAKDEEIRPLFETLCREIRRPTIGAQLASLGALQLLMAPFFQHVKLHDPKRQRFHRVLTFIDEHLPEKIKLQQLAKLMGLEPVYFSNLFTRTFGMSITQYMIKKRIDRAQELMAFSDYTFKEIAERCGFESPMYFSRLFRQKTGMTPTLFKRILHAE